MVVSLVGPLAPRTALADGTPQDRGSHTKLVRENPASNVPFVEGATAPPSTNYVTGVAEVGNTVVVVGKFTSVRNPGSGTSIPRSNIFAYDKTTGVVNSTFVPSVTGGNIDAVGLAPDGQSVFIVGNFSTVNGQARYGLAKLNVSNGQLSAGWTTTTEGRVRDAKVVGNRLFLGGDFWRVGGQTRNNLAIVNATTGAVEAFNVAVGQARVGTSSWVVSIDVSPDGSHLLASGNFIEVGGQSRNQIAMMNVASNSVATWSTQAYAATCSASFWTYMRDLEYSPDSSYFAVATTGGPRSGTLCDTAARWENTPSTANATQTWADWSGGDTLTAVAVTPKAIYVGGHNRWMNNHLGSDRAREGSVPRPGISALDPLNGVPLSWNPTRDRGSVVYTLHATSQGLYLGADTDWVNSQQKGKLAFFPFPVVGGLVPDPTPVNLPVTVFESRSDGSLTSASYNGTTASAPVVVPNTGVNWAQTLGVTVEAGKLYYTRSNNHLYSRTFDGSTFGSETDLVTDQVYTYQENGTTFNGPSLVGVTAMFWDNGRLYYTRAGQTNWFYRYLSLESGIIGSQTFTIASQGGSGFSPSGVTGMEVIGNHLYYTRTDSILRRIQWANGAPVNGTVQVMSGPAVDGRSWNGRDLFVTSTATANQPPSVSVTAPTNNSTVSGSVAMAANASDPDGTVAKVDFKVDGNIVGTDTAAAGGWTFNWNSATISNGAHTVTATATDNQGAATTSATVNITVDNVVANVPPTVSVTAPANGSTVSGSSVAMAANAADSDGTVAKVDFKVDGNIVGTDTNAAGGWTFNWNSTTTTNGAHTVTATATDNQGAATTSAAVNVTVSNPTAGSAQILLVVGSPTGLTNGDVAVRDQLLSKGHVVTIVDDDAAVVADANGKNLILISSSINSNALRDLFAPVAVPILVAKPFAFDDYGLTAAPASNYGNRSVASIAITDASHPTAAGLTGNVAFKTGNTNVTWGNATASAHVVATASGDATIFSVYPGDQLATGQAAPACRLTFPIFNDEPVTYNTNGWNMFHASVDWGISNCTTGGPPPANQPPTVSVTAPSNGSTVSGSSVSMAANAADSDGTVSKVDFKVDGNIVGTDSSAAGGWTFSWNSTTTTNGGHAITATATDDQGATTTSSSINVTVSNGGAQNPPIGDEADRVVVIAVDGLTSASISTLGSAGAPSLHKIINEGASTLNARTVYEATQTLPDHSSIFTGRKVATPGGHGVTFNEDNASTIHVSGGTYIQSIFDIVHDFGGVTALYAAKTKFDFFDRSWNGTNGAADSVGSDDGKDKLDTYSVTSGSSATSSLISQLNSDAPELAVIAFAEPDGAGHASGFGSAQYLAKVTEVDGYIGQILTAIENNAALADSTVVILTTDHGGSGTAHDDATIATHYTIPFMVWGDAISHGDLYAMNTTSRTNPGTGRPNYTDPNPVRNADTANLIADLLGLPSTAGSTINNAQTLKFGAVANTPPTVSVTAPANGSTVSGSSVAMAANAADSDGTVAKVDFKVDGNIVGTDTNAAGGWTFNWNSSTTINGAHTVTATATDNQGAATTSTTVNITVNNVVANVPPTVSVTAPTNGSTVSGSSVAMAANAADSDGTVSKVDFKVDGTIVGTDTNAAGGWTFNWNSTTITNGAHTVTATATDNQGAATTSTTVNITVNNGGTGTANILFVVGDPNGLTNGDVAVRDQLLSKGHVVTIVDDDAAVVADANGKNLVLISSSINSNVLGDLYAPVAVPVLVAKPYAFDDYGLTATPESNYGSKSMFAVTITDPTHPAAAGLSGDVNFRTGNSTYTWGTATASAHVVATAGADPTIFSVYPGDQLANGQAAAACRLTFPIFNDVPVTYNTNAWNMFHASINFGIANCG